MCGARKGEIVPCLTDFALEVRSLGSKKMWRFHPAPTSWAELRRELPGIQLVRQALSTRGLHSAPRICTESGVGGRQVRQNPPGTDRSPLT